MEAFDALVLGLVLFGAMVGLAVFLYRSGSRARAQLRADFQTAIASSLADARVDPDQNLASGRIGEHAVTARYTTRMPDDASAPWCEVEVRTLRTALQLSLRPEQAASSYKTQGLLVDVQTGDADFDRRFVVEAAPSDVVKAVLDPDLRAAISALGAVGIQSKGPGHYLIGRRGHEQLPALIALANALAQRIDRAYAEADRAQQGERGGPYRAEADANNASDRAAARAAELAELADVKERRKRHDRRVGYLVVLGLLGFVVAVVLFLMVLQR